MIESELISFGLSPKEAKVYVALLELSEAPASKIAKQAGEPRLSTYSILERLCFKQLVTQYQKKRVKIFRALSPQSFLAHCDDQILRIRAKRDRVVDFMPLLEDYFSQHGENGDAGANIQVIKDRNLFKKTVISYLDQYSDWFVIQDAAHFDLFREIFKKSKIVPRVILPFSEHNRLATRARGMEVKYVPDSCLRGPLNLMIVGDKAFFVMAEEPCFSAIEINHIHISEMMKVMFMLLFRMDFFKEEEV